MNMEYAYSITEHCMCGTPEMKEPGYDHSRCTAIKKISNPEGLQLPQSTREFRVYRMPPLTYKKLIVHCSTCSGQYNPWFRPEYEPNILYPMSSREIEEWGMLRIQHAASNTHR